MRGTTVKKLRKIAAATFSKVKVKDASFKRYNRFVKRQYNRGEVDINALMPLTKRKVVPNVTRTNT